MSQGRKNHIDKQQTWCSPFLPRYECSATRAAPVGFPPRAWRPLESVPYVVPSLYANQRWDLPPSHMIRIPRTDPPKEQTITIGVSVFDDLRADSRHLSGNPSSAHDSQLGRDAENPVALSRSNTAVRGRGDIQKSTFPSTRVPRCRRMPRRSRVVELCRLCIKMRRRLLL